MKPMARDLDILTVREVGHLLRVRPDTVYRLVRQRKIPSFRIGPYWRFRRDLIEHWMAQKSMYARQIRKVIESSANGKVRHRSLGGSGRTLGGSASASNPRRAIFP
jgi:excisionase family DNA binding protein